MSHRSIASCAALFTLLLSAACGQAGTAAGPRPPTPSCPSFEQVEEMESEELNAIPRECDDNVPVPGDKPGVYVESRVDEDGDSTPDSVRSYRNPPLTERNSLVSADDEDWFGLEWTGGVLRVQLQDATEDAFAAIVTRAGKPVPGLDDRPPGDDLRLSLARGRYFLVVARRDQHPSVLTYTLSVRAG